jgi:hypothetical protein
VICSAYAYLNCVSVLLLCRTVTSPPLPYPGEDADAEAERLRKLPPGGSQTWLLLEFCDRPCLQVTPGMWRHPSCICALLYASA